MVSCRRCAVGGTVLFKKLKTDICASETQLEETLRWSCHADSEKFEMMSSVWNICDEFECPVPLTILLNPLFMIEISYVFVFHILFSRHAIAANQCLHKRKKSASLGSTSMT